LEIFEIDRWRLRLYNKQVNYLTLLKRGKNEKEKKKTQVEIKKG